MELELTRELVTLTVNTSFSIPGWIFWYAFAILVCTIVSFIICWAENSALKAERAEHKRLVAAGYKPVGGQNFLCPGMANVYLPPTIENND